MLSHRINLSLLSILLASVLSGCSGNDEAVQRDSLVYVALGASDAVGVGATNPAREGWVPRLHAQMPEGTKLVNLGVSGSELSEALDQQLPVALAARPDIVTIWLAVNDFKNGVPLARYERDLDSLLGELRKTDALITVGNVPDLASLPIPDFVLRQYGVGSLSQLRAEVARWNAAIARVARKHGAVLVDIHAQWRELQAHPEYISGDAFHPSTQGYARLAELWWSKLAPVIEGRAARAEAS